MIPGVSPYSKIQNQSSSSLSCWLCALFVLIKQMKEEELIRTKHVGEVMKVLHDATDHAYNPDELLTVPLFFSCFLSRDSWVPTLKASLFLPSLRILLFLGLPICLRIWWVERSRNFYLMGIGLIPVLQNWHWISGTRLHLTKWKWCHHKP